MQKDRLLHIPTLIDTFEGFLVEKRTVQSGEKNSGQYKPSYKSGRKSDFKGLNFATLTRIIR